jgi:hypothetical protein
MFVLDDALLAAAAAAAAEASVTAAGTAAASTAAAATAGEVGAGLAGAGAASAAGNSGAIAGGLAGGAELGGASALSNAAPSMALSGPAIPAGTPTAGIPGAGGGISMAPPAEIIGAPGAGLEQAQVAATTPQPSWFARNFGSFGAGDVSKSLMGGSMASQAIRSMQRPGTANNTVQQGANSGFYRPGGNMGGSTAASMPGQLLPGQASAQRMPWLQGLQGPAPMMQNPGPLLRR